ncbi:MAG: sigma-54-dependent Fis family transcriptional regulator [Deltaproteobacteria bacterium]|nr:sigma-54-dependent Fis family transcriptional regulator [Deltaproteobacteria bacterium]
MSHGILIVDEDIRERSNLCQTLESLGYDAVASPGGSDAVEKLKSGGCGVVVANYDTLRFDPLTFLDQLLTVDPDIRTIFMSQNASVDAAVDMMKAGGFDFVLKPVETEQLTHIIQRAMGPVDEAAGKPAQSDRKTRIMTQDKTMQRILDLARQVADSRASVLIQGESGTGKEMIARYVHENSSRRQSAFVAVNCGALPETLLESELFGHEKGAFTGAIARKPGKFELAHNGTILLDEITEMPFHLQAKLLRVLQEREVDRVGGGRPVAVDVRVLATSNQDMKGIIEEKKFREDLFYRLNVIPIKLPPLRDRSGDIPLLTQHFIEKYNALDGRYVKSLAESAAQKLSALPYKGNVRELENIIERAVLLCDGACIYEKDLFLAESFTDEHTQNAAGMELPADFAPRPLREVEKSLIFQTLGQTNGNRTHAAKILGISVRTLRNKLNEYKEKLEAE